MCEEWYRVLAVGDAAIGCAQELASYVKWYVGQRSNDDVVDDVIESALRLAQEDVGKG